MIHKRNPTIEEVAGQGKLIKRIERLILAGYTFYGCKAGKYKYFTVFSPIKNNLESQVYTGKSLSAAIRLVKRKRK